MTRYEYISKGGLPEMAKAIAYWAVESANMDIDVPCDIFVQLVKESTPKFERWLGEEIDV